ncbi:MAG: hydroxymethylglutaryl-CoA lyase [Frankiales bacterium]|nr:hydroxymethylglutaryl-CoA lyase [Frankiales bacterium]
MDPRTADVQVVEVSARDGLQNDPAELSTAQKVELVRRTTAAGLRRQEVASFVSPTRVPRMADAEAVVAALADDADRDAAAYIGLVLNVRGFERAAATRLDEVNLVVAASDAFTERNQGMTTDAAVATVEQVAPLARAAGLVPTVTVSTSFGCPFSGEVPVDHLVALCERLAASGVEELALADTIGVAVPRDVVERVRRVRAATGDVRLRAHFHNTRNTGYANALAAFEEGVAVLDASLGGIGGCPFAPRATGNIATEDLVYLLERSGVRTGLDLDALIAAGEWLGEELGRPTPSLVAKAGGFPTGE